MLSTLVVAGAFLQAANAQPIDLDDAPPTVEPTWEPTVEPEPTAEPALEILPEGYVYGTADHDSCPTDYIPITSASECQNAAQIMGMGWYGARGIGVCTYITNSQHVKDNDKFFYGPIGATENNTADHHTLVCKRPECGEIERNYDYVGGHFLAVPDVDSAETCARVCAAEPHCHSFTYVKKANNPNYKMCNLKSELKNMIRTLDDCCDSGLPCAEGEAAACVSLPPDWMDQDGDGCTAYGNGGWCGAAWQGMFAAGGYTADEACCECGGGIARRRMETNERAQEMRLALEKRLRDQNRRMETNERDQEMRKALEKRLRAQVMHKALEKRLMKAAEIADRRRRGFAALFRRPRGGYRYGGHRN